MNTPLCEFEALENTFNFGKYRDLSLADVLDINPSYLDWCVKHCTGITFILYDEVIEEIKNAYPDFTMDKLFHSRRLDNLNQIDFYDNQYSNDYLDECQSDFDDTATYGKYSGSWAQDVEGYSDDDIDTIFDGDPDAYWNID